MHLATHRQSVQFYLLATFQHLLSPPIVHIAHRAEDQRLFARECIGRKASIERQPEQRFSATLRWLAASDVHPMAYQAELENVSQCMQARPGLTDEWQSEEVQEKLSQARTYGKSAVQEGLAVAEKLGRWFRTGGSNNEK